MRVRNALHGMVMARDGENHARDSETRRVIDYEMQIQLLTVTVDMTFDIVNPEEAFNSLDTAKEHYERRREKY